MGRVYEVLGMDWGVSADGVNWYHLLGSSCSLHLPS
jgi:hypothetical protein